MLTKHDFAEDIGEDLLFRTGRALLTGKAKEFAACFWLPTVVESLEGVAHIQTDHELQNVYQNVRNNLQTNGVKNLARSVISAEYLEDDIIGSTHVSQRLDKDGAPIAKPYPVYSTLKRSNSEWRIESSIYAVLDDPLLNKALSCKYRTIF